MHKRKAHFFHSTFFFIYATDNIYLTAFLLWLSSECFSLTPNSLFSLNSFIIIVIYPDHSFLFASQNCSEKNNIFSRASTAYSAQARNVSTGSNDIYKIAFTRDLWLQFLCSCHVYFCRAFILIRHFSMNAFLIKLLLWTLFVCGLFSRLLHVKE